MKTLVLILHSDMSTSRANRPLVAKVEALGDGVIVRYMYDPCPDQKIDVAAEQTALGAADRVVFQLPTCWYSTPALFRQRLDDVLLCGWAYDSTGKVLAGKELLMAISTGGPGDAYSHESSCGYTLTKLLRSLQATANMVQMACLAPLTTTGVLTITDETLTQRTEGYAATLQSTDLPVLDLRG